jgi:regulator of protease activity HflC (stomatin/prohibitin superfamily)
MDSGFVLVIVAAIVLFIFYLLFSIIRIVPDYERLVILQLGRYKGTRGPGITPVWPLLEKAFKVDLRERFLDIPAQTAITRDNAPISVDFLVYYRIVDPALSVLKVDHVVRASLNIATTTLRAVIGDIDLDDVLAKREQINDTLRVKLDEITERWGMKITSVEIREIEPPREVQDAMNRQMSAERERRATVTRAAGEREAAIAVAEGEKQAAILRAEGDRESAIARAEGERQAQLLRAQGYAKALKAILEEAQHLDEKTMILQYLDALEKVGASPSTKFVLPMELTSMMTNFAAIMGGNGSSTANPAPRVTERVDR